MSHAWRGAPGEPRSTVPLASYETASSVDPVITSINGPGDLSDRAATFSVQTNETADKFCKLLISNGTDTQVLSDWQNCTYGITYNNLVSAHYTLQVFARGSYGNVSEFRTVEFTVS